jgi:hypothetical protein
MKVWKVETDLTIEENEFIEDLFSEADGQVIRDMQKTDSDIYNWDDVSENGFMIPYFICDDSAMETLVELCDKYHIKFLPNDITTDFMMGLVSIPDSDFTRFREDYLDEDTVYLKIKKFGVESLDEIDKKVLNESI